MPPRKINLVEAADRMITKVFDPHIAGDVNDAQAKVRLSAFAWCRAADHFGAVLDRGLRMEGAVLAGEALADDLGVLVDQDGHE